MRTTTARLGRRSFALAVVGAIGLTACGSDEIADFEDTGGSDASDAGGGASDGGGDAAAEDLPQLDPGFLEEDFTKDVTVTSTLHPENSTVITPTGTLSIDGLQELTAVPADAVDVDPELNEDGEALDFAAAPGEVLRAVDLSFTPVGEDAPGGGDGLPATDLSVRAGGSQTHLAEIDGEYSNRILLSLPEDGSAVLVVSCEGHDQLVDLLTGERQGDDVAAVYYRQGRVQEPHHTFPVSVDPFPVLYGGAADHDIEAAVSFQATTLALTAWTADTGWAEPGGAWLVMDWSSEITIDTETPGLVEAGAYTAIASVTVDGEATTQEVHLDDLMLSPSSNTEKRTLIAPVAAETTAATVSMSGQFSVEFDASPGSYELDGSSEREFTSDELGVEFPLEGASASAEPSDGGGS